MIITEKIKLTTKELFNILIANYLKKRWWLLLWIWVMIVILLLRERHDNFGYFIVAALIALQLIILFQYWGYAKSKDNKQLLQERYYEIDSDRINGITADGKATSLEVIDFISVAKTSKYYMLYTTKTDYIYISANSFKSAEDKEWFEEEIISKIKS